METRNNLRGKGLVVAGVLFAALALALFSSLFAVPVAPHGASGTLSGVSQKVLRSLYFDTWSMTPPSQTPEWAGVPGDGGRAPLPPGFGGAYVPPDDKTPVSKTPAELGKELRQLVSDFKSGPNPFDSFPQSKHQGGTGVQFVLDSEKQLAVSQPNAGEFPSKQDLAKLEKQASGAVDNDAPPFVDAHEKAKSSEDFNRLVGSDKGDSKLPPYTSLQDMLKGSMPNRVPPPSEVFSDSGIAKIRAGLEKFNNVPVVGPENARNAFESLNAIRREFDLPPLEWDQELYDKWVADWLSRDGFWRHLEDAPGYSGKLSALGNQLGYVSLGNTVQIEEITGQLNFGRGKLFGPTPSYPFQTLYPDEEYPSIAALAWDGFYQSGSQSFNKDGGVGHFGRIFGNGIETPNWSDVLRTAPTHGCGVIINGRLIFVVGNKGS